MVVPCGQTLRDDAVIWLYCVNRSLGMMLLDGQMTVNRPLGMILIDGQMTVNRPLGMILIDGCTVWTDL